MALVLTLLAGVSGGVSLTILNATPSAAAMVITVPTDKPTIQSAIDAATAGDTVVVQPGTYFEHITFSGKAIEVRSAGGPSVTTIDGSSTGSVVMFANGENASSVLRGFTITHGSGQLGGGISITNASPTIVGNAVVENQTLGFSFTGSAGGVGLVGGSALVKGNLIASNNGGGIATNGSAATIRANVIRDNRGDGSHNWGGGVLLYGGGDASVVDNLIEGNLADFGGGVALFGAGAATVRSNVIRANTGSFTAGIETVNESGSRIVNNLVVDNHGPGMSVSASIEPGPYVIGNTIANNARGDLTITGGAPSTTYENNIVLGAIYCYFELAGHLVYKNNNGGNYDAGCGNPTGTNANVSADPKFVDPANGNYRLQAGSPSINVGDSAAPMLPATDLDEGPRVVGVIDHGAYESPGSAAGTARLFIDSEADELVGQGHQLFFTTATTEKRDSDSCGAQCSDVLTFHASTAGHDYEVRFSAARGSNLAPGTYAHAVPPDVRAGALPGLEVVGDLHRCGTSVGRFTVDTATFDGSGNVTSFAARFEQQCTTGTAALFGAVVFNASDDRRRTITSNPMVFENQRIGTVGTRALTITNTGVTPLTISALGSLSGADASQFGMASNTCVGATLNQTQSCSAQISFTPTGTPGTRTATMQLVDSSLPSGSGGRAVALVGTASPPVPDAPTLSASAGAGVVNLSWNTPNSPGSAIFGYNVYRATTSGAQELLDTTGTSPTYTDTSVTADGSTTYFYQVSAVNETGEGARSNEVSSAPNPTPVGEFTSLNPARILDTRTSNGGHPGALGSGETFSLQVTGRGGVPATGVLAVVLNVTVTEPTAPGYLTAWPAGIARPGNSNLNFVKGQTVPNAVTVAIGTGGKVNFFNFDGSTHVVVDVVGYYASSAGKFGSRFHSTSPFRFFDTRNNTGGVGTKPVGPGASLQFKVTGGGGVPSSGVTAVVLNVTATEPNASSFVTVHPSDVTRPEASSLNVVPGLTVPNLVTVRVPADGRITFYNHSGTTHLIADVVGYYDGDKTSEAGRLLTGAPVRVFDSRAASPFPPPGSLPPGGVLSLTGLSSEVAAVIFNVTATEPTADGYVTVFPSPPPPPNASNLNFVAGQTVPNLVIVGVGSNGAIGFYNFAGRTHLVVDIFGAFTSSAFNASDISIGAATSEVWNATAS